MEKNLPEHEIFEILHAFSVSAFQDLPEPLVYSLADAEQEFVLQEPKDWKEGVQKHFKGDEINLTIVNEQDSDSESESWVITAQEEEVQGDASTPVEDEKAAAEAEPTEKAEEEEEKAEEVEAESTEKADDGEQPQEPRSLRERVMQFVSEIGTEGMQNLVAVTFSLLKEGVPISDALRTAVETSDVAASHPFTQDLLAVQSAYAEKMQVWLPCVMNFNIDHIIAMIPNMVESITQALEGTQHVELDLSPIFKLCNPEVMARLQGLIPNGEDRVFNVDPQNPFAVFQEAEAAVEEEFAPEPKVVHKGVICDGCDMDPIVGVRYKSTLRSNYDLCEECETKHDVNDPLLKIKKPIGEIDLLPGMSEFGNSVGRHRGRHCRRGRGRGRCRMFRRCGPGPRWKFMKEMKMKFMEEIQKKQCQEAEEVRLDRRDPTKVEAAPEVIEDEQPRKEEKAAQNTMKKESKKLIRAAKKEVKALRKSAWCLKKCKSKEANEKAEEILRTAEAKEKFVEEVKKQMKEAKARPLDSKVVAHLDMDMQTTQEPGSCVLKTWKMKNIGSAAWPEETYAVFVGGNKSLLPEGYTEVYVGPINAGDVTYVHIMIDVPDVPGSYFVNYKLMTADGKFGQKMRTVVDVKKAAIKPEMVRQEIIERQDSIESIQSAEEDGPPEFNRPSTVSSIASAMEDSPDLDRASTVDSIATAIDEDIPNAIDDILAPSAPVPPQYEHAEMIQVLKSMGFDRDDETLNSLLVCTGGNLEQAIHNMLM